VLFQEIKASPAIAEFYRWLDVVKEIPREKHNALIANYFPMLDHYLARGHLSRRIFKQGRLGDLGLDMRVLTMLSRHPRWRFIILPYARAITRNKPTGTDIYMYEPPFGCVKALIKGTPGAPIKLGPDLRRPGYPPIE
jgi:hypothetical protein